MRTFIVFAVFIFASGEKSTVDVYTIDLPHELSRFVYFSWISKIAILIAPTDVVNGIKERCLYMIYNKVRQKNMGTERKNSGNNYSLVGLGGCLVGPDVKVVELVDFRTDPWTALPYSL